MEELIREKRLRWYGHLIREDDADVAKETMLRQIQDLTKWGKQLIKDFEERKLDVIQAPKMARDKAHWRQLSHARLPQVIGAKKKLGARWQRQSGGRRGA